MQTVEPLSFALVLSDLATPLPPLLKLQSLTHSTPGGIVELERGFKLQVSNEGYQPRAGDVFHLIKAGSNGYSGVRGNLDLPGSFLRTGMESGAQAGDLELFELGGNFRWDTRLIDTLGVLVVVSMDSQASGALPVFVANSTKARRVLDNVEIPSGAVLDNGAPFLLETSVRMSSAELNPVFTALCGASSAVADPPLVSVTIDSSGDRIYKVVYLIYANTGNKGQFAIRASNSFGSVVSPSVLVDVNDKPLVIQQPTLPAGKAAPGSTVAMTAKVVGQGPYRAVWSKTVAGVATMVSDELALFADGKFASTLTLENVDESSEGTYSCTFSAVEDASLAVTTNALSLVVADLVTSVTASRTRGEDFLYTDEVASFQVQHDGEVDGVSYTWYLGPRGNSTAISNVDSFVVAGSATSRVLQVRIPATWEGSSKSIYCEVRGSATNMVISNVLNFSLLRPAPSITSSANFRSMTLAAGRPMRLEVATQGRPPLTYTWRRTGRVVQTGSSPVYQVASTSGIDGGVYTLQVSNSAGSVTVATPAEVVVVGTAAGVQEIRVAGQVGGRGGARFDLPAVVGRASTTEVSYSWFRRKTVLVDDLSAEPNEDGEYPQIETILDEPLESSRFSGALQPASKLANVLRLLQPAVDTDDGLYVYKVAGPGNTTVDGIVYDVKVLSLQPLNDTPAKLRFGMVGGFYSDSIRVNETAASEDERRSRAATLFTATKLPAGLRVNTLTGVISGVPTVAGKFKITTQARNAIGVSSVVESEIEILPISPALAGSYNGTVARSAGLNGGLGGRVDFAISKLGAISGKIILGSTAAKSFAGPLTFVQDDATGALLEAPRASLTIPATAKEPAFTLSFRLAITPASGSTPARVNVELGEVSSAGQTASFNGWKRVWGATALTDPQAGLLQQVPTEYVGLYNVGWMLPDASRGNALLPQGAGYASVRVIAAGTYQIAGRTADGETVTSTGNLGPNGEVFVFQTLYKTLQRGSVLSDDAGTVAIESLRIDKGATAGLDDNELTGILSQVRPADAPSARLYRDGFGLLQPVNFELMGGIYLPPVAGAAKVLLDVNPANQAGRLEFDQDGVFSGSGFGRIDGSGSAATSFSPSVDVDILAGSVVKVSASNLFLSKTKTSLKAVAATGAFSGGFSLVDTDSTSALNPRPTVTRASTFQGLIVREKRDSGWVVYGVGYFLVDTMPTLVPATTIRTSPRVSGMAIFKPQGAVLP